MKHHVHYMYIRNFVCEKHKLQIIQIRHCIPLCCHDSLYIQCISFAYRETGGRTTRVLSQETAALVNQPVSWEVSASARCTKTETVSISV